MEFIIANLGDIVVGTAVFAVLAAIVVRMTAGSRSGGTGYGCGCGCDCESRQGCENAFLEGNDK